MAYSLKIWITIVMITGRVFAAGSSDKYINDLTFTKNYYFNPEAKDMNGNGSFDNPFRDLSKISNLKLNPADSILLAAGTNFKGSIVLSNVKGTTEHPIVISSYKCGNASTDNQAIIDAKGFMAAIRIENSGNIVISNLELTSDAGTPKEQEARIKRYGVWIIADEPGNYSNISLMNLKIHHIFATENVKGSGQNPTSNMGYGIFVGMTNKDALISNIRIEDCSIEMTGHTGLQIFGFGDNTGSTYLDNVNIINNQLRNIGGPGMVPGRCKNVLVRGNVVDYSGSSADSRMHARGSGIWPWTCNNVLIEKNKFMHARGKNDSCGAHIDFNCNNVVVQYNLSIDNAGGFVEILGNDQNCAYRYNISINDGFRVKGQDGAQQNGHILWTSGYTGEGNKRIGPFNSYIYNNTIFVKEGSRSCFSFATTTEGILIANNIFYILGKTVAVTIDKDVVAGKNSPKIPNVVFTNNLYENANILPDSLIISDSNPILGNPEFRNSGGLIFSDYLPLNVSLIKNKGIEITKLPSDLIGLKIGLKVEYDILGNKISGLPDIGAIESQ